MTIETKYNIGQEVWFLFDGKPLNGKIARISEYTIKVKVIFKDGKEYLFSRDIKGFELFPNQRRTIKKFMICHIVDYCLSEQRTIWKQFLRIAPILLPKAKQKWRFAAIMLLPIIGMIMSLQNKTSLTKM